MLARTWVGLGAVLAIVAAIAAAAWLLVGADSAGDAPGRARASDASSPASDDDRASGARPDRTATLPALEPARSTGEASSADSAVTRSEPDGEAASSARISGRVLTALGAPLPGAHVALLESNDVQTIDYDLIELLRRVQAADQARTSVVASADGSFWFSPVDPGPYVIAAGKPGWQVRYSAPIEVKADARTPFIELRLAEALLLRGTVRNASGRPVSGAQIAALEVEPMALRYPRSQKTATGPDGRFSYAAFGGGEIALIVSAAGYASTTRGNIRASEGDVDIVLEPAVRIAGRVYDSATGKGLAGATVTAVRFGASLGLAQTRSGEDGSFSLENAPPGDEPVIFAKLDGYAMARPSDRSDEDAAHVAEGDFVAGTSVRHDLPMVKGASIAGRVVDGVTGEPIAGAEVVARHGAEVIATTDPVRARSGADGRFVLPAIGPGSVSVSASAAEYVAPNPQDEDEIVAVEVVQGVAVEGVVVRLSKGCELDVLVKDETGPVAGAVVAWALPDEKRGDLFGPRHETRRVTTDGAGRARFGGLPARERIQLAARHVEGGASGHATAATPAPEGTVVTITLVRAPSLQGVLIYDGRPAPGYEVSVSSEDAVGSVFGEWTLRGKRAVTDASGRFLIENLQAGRGSIHVRPLASGTGGSEVLLDPSDGVLELAAGERREVTLNLVRTEPISGIVRGSDGVPLAGVNVSATIPGASPETAVWAQSGADGRFELSGLRPGSYRVEGHWFGGPAGHQIAATSASTGTSTLELRFGP